MAESSHEWMNPPSGYLLRKLWLHRETETERDFCIFCFHSCFFAQTYLQDCRMIFHATHFWYDNRSCIWYGVNVEFANTGFECGVAESTNSSSNITKYNAKFYFEPSRSCWSATPIWAAWGNLHQVGSGLLLGRRIWWIQLWFLLEASVWKSLSSW